MSITRSAADLLPDFGQPVTPAALSQPASVSAVHGEVPSQPAILRDISGCVALIGPVEICYDVNISIPSVSLALKVGPVTVMSGEIDPTHPCLSFKGDYGLAKWNLNLCLNGSSVTLNGQACVTFVGCKSFNVTIISW